VSYTYLIIVAKFQINSPPPSPGRVKDPHLKEKATTLPKLITSAYSTSTLRKYKPAWEKWISWSAHYSEVSACPADPFYIAIYFNDIVTSQGKAGTLESAFLGIRWVT